MTAAVQVEPQKYFITCIPHDGSYLASDLRDSLGITVNFRGYNEQGEPKWGIHARNENLRYNKRTGTWDYEPLPSARREDWLADVQFTLDEALEIASLMAPHISWNYFTVPTALKLLALPEGDTRDEYRDALIKEYRDRRAN